ncbi:MAG: family 20 glycosylhydrolase, partial [Opitutaceae bacterium]
MPAPSSVSLSGGRMPAPGRLLVTLSGASDARLDAAISRAEERWQSRVAAGGNLAPFRLVISRERPGPLVPSESEDESYRLEVDGGQATLSAPTTLGVLHGLETLLQLPARDLAGWYLPAVVIIDRPRFPWRGLMIDVARHWQPMEVIERNLDVMAVVKLNVLHLHLTDDQG